MKITLIAPILSDFGLCTISPQLKAKGHEVRSLFVPSLMENNISPLSKKDAVKIDEFIAGSGLIGLNCFSENFHKTSVLADHIKNRSSAPIVWGGVHATLRPQDCMQHADIVCVGEGEEAVVELAYRLERKEPLGGIKNLLFRSEAQGVKRAELRPPVDIDSLLPLDYDLSSQHILKNGKIRNVEASDFNGTLISYISRGGCPYRCSYCCNELMIDMYKGHRYYRQRSIDNVFLELAMIKKTFPDCKQIWFNDADFLAYKTEEYIGCFSRKYKEEVNIPFGIWSNPASVSDEKMRALKTAGLKWIAIGTIHGDEDIQKNVYNRNATIELYRSCAKILGKYNPVIEYDFILCNPYERDENLLKTINLLISLPKPFKTVIYSLAYFPGTKLYERVLKDGILSGGYHTQGYTKASYRVWNFQFSAYLNAVASLMRGRARKTRLGIVFYGLLPEPVLKFLIKKPVINFFNHLPFRSLIFGAIAGLIIISYKSVAAIRYSCKALIRLLRKSLLFPLTK